ncbi:hypothetical protein C495_07720, partial [Natronorubrum sulfidifaciens JCM 14089]
MLAGVDVVARCDHSAIAVFDRDEPVFWRRNIDRDVLVARVDGLDVRVGVELEVDRLEFAVAVGVDTEGSFAGCGPACVDLEGYLSGFAGLEGQRLLLEGSSVDAERDRFLVLEFGRVGDCLLYTS